MINKDYKYLEIETGNFFVFLDGLFKPFLLLKKLKYTQKNQLKDPKFKFLQSSQDKLGKVDRLK